MRYLENFTAATPITYKIPGNFFYLDSLPGGLATIRFFKNGVRLPEDLTSVIAGWHAMIREGFDEVEISSTLTQALSFYIARGEVGANVFSGNVAVTSVAGNAYATAFASSTALLANTPQNVITAGANVNGYTLHDAEMSEAEGGGGSGFYFSALAKATAPATVIDGDVLLLGKLNYLVAGTFSRVSAQLQHPVRVIAGKRLDFIGGLAETSAHRKALYTLD